MEQLTFAGRVIAWQRGHGRHDLPWQVSDPYRVWLSEIMLQQTQVTAVLPYYLRFLDRFPTLAALAAAPLDDVLALWSGLGYYSRARNLHRAACLVMERFGGRFPDSREAIETLPGVGRSTAAAIAAFAFGRREAILDGNVKRVLTRAFAIDGFPGDRKIETGLWQLAESLLPERDIGVYTQGLMDLGATVCRRGRPLCDACPLAADCRALADDRVAELPAPRPKKALPTRYTTMLLAVHRGRVWLTRRPPTGIWGGLLSLPECDGLADAEALAARLGCGDWLPAWPELAHGFTHFRLVITPQPLKLDALAPVAAEDGGIWLTPPAAMEAGVPAPVRRLLQKLDDAPI